MWFVNFIFNYFIFEHGLIEARLAPNCSQCWPSTSDLPASYENSRCLLVVMYIFLMRFLWHAYMTLLQCHQFVSVLEKFCLQGGMISSSLSSFLKQYSMVAIYAALEVMHHLDMIQKMWQIWLNASATLLYMKTEHYMKCSIWRVLEPSQMGCHTK